MLRYRTGLHSLGYDPEPVPCLNEKLTISDIATKIQTSSKTRRDLFATVPASGFTHHLA